MKLRTSIPRCHPVPEKPRQALPICAFCIVDLLFLLGAAGYGYIDRM
jgi:hypothetical protein